MTLCPVVLFASDATWQVGAMSDGLVMLLDIPSPDTSSATEGIAPGQVILALPSAWCLCATVDLAGIAKGNSRLFALEEQLPIAAEEVVADLIPHAGKALGICTNRERLVALVEQWEKQGWRIAAVCPAPLLALSSWLDSVPQRTDAVLAREGQQWVLLVLEEDHLKSWHLLPADMADLELRLHLLRKGAISPLRLCMCGLPETLHDSLAANPDVQLLAPCLPSLKMAATTQAAAILAGHQQPPCDLALPGRPPLASRRLRRPLAAAALGLVVLLISFTLALHLASWRLDRHSSSLEAEQARLFRQVVPSPRVRTPRAVARYLASELERRNSMISLAETPRVSSALQMLLDVVTRLPQQMPLQLTRLRLEGDRAEMAGEVRAHEDAGAVAAALGRDGLLQVQPPQTSTGRNQGVSFTLQVECRKVAHAKEQP